MKWLSVLALCAALFIAGTHASQLQDEADEENILQMLLAGQENAENAENDKEIELAIEETPAVYKGRISSAREKANVQCDCRCSRGRWQKASKAQRNARAQCKCCGGWLI